MKNKKLLFFTLIFALAVFVDLLKFFLNGKPTVVNWESFIHPFWVITAIVTLTFSSFFTKAHKVTFWLYFGVFAFAYVNIYFQFTEKITYFCMIFNLVLVSVLLFSKNKPTLL